MVVRNEQRDDEIRRASREIAAIKGNDRHLFNYFTVYVPYADVLQRGTVVVSVADCWKDRPIPSRPVRAASPPAGFHWIMGQALKVVRQGSQ